MNETTETQVSGAPAPDERAPSEQPAEPTAPSGPEIDPTRLDADAVRVLLRLRQAGHEAYLVGGCVRDLLIGREPKDFDIATSATPNQVRNLFRNCRLIGRRFRLAHVYFKGGKILEVSTFRANPGIVEEPQPSEAAETEVLSEGAEHIAQADKEALDAVEHDAEIPSTPVDDVQDEVAPPAPASTAAAPERDLLITEDNTFGNAIEDAVRRDFTINGLFYDPAQGMVIDHVNGLRDLAEREIRTIGDPEKRLREDPVRILRAVRFASKLEFEFEPRTYAAMEAAVEDLPRCSAPRLMEESFRLIRSGHAANSLRLLAGLDALGALLPPLAAYLKAQDKEGFDEYFAFLSAMDERVNAKVPFDDSMLLACALLPVALDEVEPTPTPTTPVAPAADPEAVVTVEGAPAPSESAEAAPAAAPADEPKPTLAQAIESLLNELVQKARLPRRIAERCRMILLNQRTLSGQRRRRGGLNGFRSHPLFKESLEVFAVWVAATGEHVEALEKWRSGAAPLVAQEAEGPRRKRRRRRRGGGGGGGPRPEPSQA